MGGFRSKHLCISLEISTLNSQWDRHAFSVSAKFHIQLTAMITMPGSSLENYFPKAHLYLTGLRVYSVWKAFSPEALSKTISSDCLTQQQLGAVRTLGTKTSCQKSSNGKPENEMFKGLFFLSINKILGIWKVICMYKGCVPAPSCVSDVEETQSNRTNVKKNLLINLLRQYV